MSAASRRCPPGSACVACRRMKMRCTQTTSWSCERCLRLGRTCVATEPHIPSAADEAHVTPAIEIGPEQDPDFAQTIAPEPASERLAGLHRYLGSAAVSHDANHRAQEEPEPGLHTRPYWSATDYISAAEAADWILFFKERLVPTAPVLDPNAYTNHESIVRDQPHLAACIVYVSSVYIAGYSGLRVAMQKGLNEFSRAMLETQPATSAQQLTDMHVLIILYNFARPEAVCSLPVQEFTSMSDLLSTKAICESYAFRIGLFKTADDVLSRTRSGQSLQRSDQCVQLYLVWLWLFSNSHHVAMITGTPPTITPDATIRASPMLLEGLKSELTVLSLVADAELCLTWYTLGNIDPGIKEWWCGFAFRGIQSYEENKLTAEDVDRALEACKHRSWISPYRTLGSVMAFFPEFFFRYTRFCLYRCLIPQAETTTERASYAREVERCILAAVNFLSLPNEVGPYGKDQLRYIPGFVFVLLSQCASFTLKTVNALAVTVVDINFAVEVIRRLAEFMLDLEQKRSTPNATIEAGRSVLRQVEAQCESGTDASTTVDQTTDENEWLQNYFDQQLLEFNTNSYVLNMPLGLEEARNSPTHSPFN